MANPIPSVPTRSTMFQGDGTPEGAAVVKQLGNLTREWSLFFATESAWILQLTHVERLATEAGSVPDGGITIESDRSSIYASRWVGKKKAWVFVVGRMQGSLANRPADLGTNDAGFLYLATDTGLEYGWNGSAWTVSGTQVIDQTLVAASTTIAKPTTGAVDLVVILRQDATGGRAVVWGAGFSAASVSLGDAVASSIATFRFVLSGGSYVMVGQPTVDMTP